MLRRRLVLRLAAKGGRGFQPADGRGVHVEGPRDIGLCLAISEAPERFLALVWRQLRWTPETHTAGLRTLPAFTRAGADKHSGEVSPSVKGRALDKVAKIVGKDRKTIQKARAVRDAARAEPEKFGKLLEQMDGTGRVNGVYRRLCIARQAEAIRKEPPPLPGNGPYRVASIDFPWPYEVRSQDPSKRGVRPYPTMSIEQMCVLPVASIMHEDSILWMWTTNALPPLAPGARLYPRCRPSPKA